MRFNTYYIGYSFRCLLIISQLGLACYFTYMAWTSWDASPEVSSVGFKQMTEVPFPAVTICAPTEGKWMSVAKMIEQLGVEKEIWLQMPEDIHYEFISLISIVSQIQDWSRLAFMNRYEYNWIESMTELFDMTVVEIKMGCLVHYTQMLII
jgi:hypothetical protein